MISIRIRGVSGIHNRCNSCNDDAFTGLELVVVIALLIGGAVILLGFIGGGETAEGPRTFPEGTVAESAYASGDHLQPVGSMYGFSAVSRTLGDTEVRFEHPDPEKLGAVRLMVSLFMGSTGAIDMDRVDVNWTSLGSDEQIRQTTPRPLICPNWTIAGKYNLLPGRTADSDNWLEPGEQFEILACPSTSVQPYGVFTLIVHPDGSAMPLRLTRTVPAGIRPVMNLK